MEETANVQGIGFAGKLTIVWGTVMFPMQDTVMVMDTTTGNLNFIFNGNKESALAVKIMENENLKALVASQKDGENMTRDCMSMLRDLLVTQLLNDSVLVIDLDLALNSLGRREDANG